MFLRGRVVGARQALRLRLSSSRCGLLVTTSDCGRVLYFIVDQFFLFLSDVAEDVVENKVSVGLASEDEGLGELAVGQRLVRDFTDDLDDDVLVGGLRVDVGDADLAVLEVELFDAVVDGLRFPR